MHTMNYSPPVDKLLTLGDAREVGTTVDDWSSYIELGIGPEHIPDLIRMTTNKDLLLADSDSLEVWAPIHAWRTLGALQAEAAIEPLLSMLAIADNENDDWVMEELTDVYGMIGPAAIPALEAYLADTSHGIFARATASTSLGKIGTNHPASRDACIAAISGPLESSEANDPELNGFLLCDLIRLKAVEAAPVIERAFAANAIDPMIAGDWGDVQVSLGLKTRAEVPQRRYNQLTGTVTIAGADEKAVSPPGPSSPMPQRKQQVDPKKAKNKMAKLSRKKNKKRK